MPEGILSHCPDLGAFCIIHALNTMQKKKMLFGIISVSQRKLFVSSHNCGLCRFRKVIKLDFKPLSLPKKYQYPLMEVGTRCGQCWHYKPAPLAVPHRVFWC